MTDQLALLEQEPEQLTPRQQQALELLRAAGPDGMTGYELGVALYGDRPEARSWGGSAGHALRRKGLAAQRGRPRVWVALTEPGDDKGLPVPAIPPGSVSGVPPDGLPVYGSMPEGF